ncbi:Flagellar hook protein FlgE [compost metagenome]
MGQISGGALEDSNVDLTGELVNLIKAQSNYQANAKTISTESTIMQTIIQMT